MARRKAGLFLYTFLLLLLSSIALAAWLYLLLLHGRFWLPPEALRAAEVAPSPTVAVIVPARDEADVIGPALASLLAQDYPGEVRIFVVDDHSSDGTAQVVRALRDPRTTLITGAPLPQGWSGKVWAMEQGWQAAQACAPEFVLLTDADIAHAPDNLRALVSKAVPDDLDLVSLMVRLHCRGVAERLLVPAFVYFFFLLYPPRWIADPRCKTAGAAGGCVLVRAQALRRAGAFASIQGEIIDDCAFAARVKASAGKLWLGLGDETRSLRPYNGFAGIARMIARTAFNQLRHSSWLLLGCVAGMLLTFVAPVALLFVPDANVRLTAAIACSLMVASYLPLASFYRTPLTVLTLPMAAIFYLCATFQSAVSYWRGTGGAWKGRAQDQ